LVSSRGNLIQIYLSSANIANLFWPAENLLKKKIVTPLLLEPTPECDATPIASGRCKLTSTAQACNDLKDWLTKF